MPVVDALVETCGNPANPPAVPGAKTQYLDAGSGEMQTKYGMIEKRSAEALGIDAAR
ncbi:MAG: hypothetical protein JSW50_13995 [Candidatus Latescibacterota bacterium]|nr:MAG: hypothetical protein JSW50_13995 [Candidatus Latescibacterota bacterium]